jgi:hypothetical protein
MLIKYKFYYKKTQLQTIIIMNNFFKIILIKDLLLYFNYCSYFIKLMIRLPLKD